MMPSRIKETVFREPSGRRDTFTLVQFAGAVVFASMYGYYTAVGAGSLGWLLGMTAGFALSGIAESLPVNRRQAAGILRLTSILVFASLLVAGFLAPQFVWG